MGLDIYLYETKPKLIANFRGNTIFLDWVISNIREIDTCHYVEIDKSDIEKLQRQLNCFQQRYLCQNKNFSEDDFDFEFEHHQGDKDFYLKIAEIHHWCNEILANFNFDDASLLFSASW